MSHDVFISYSRYDSAIVEEFVAALGDECFSIWIDRDGIESGDAFKRQILRAIKESQVVLFFSSKHSNQSEWTAKEIGVAVKYKKHIIPIKLDNSNFNEDIEFDLINLDFIDYSVVATRAGMKERLLKSLRNKLRKGRTESKVQKEVENIGAVNGKTERKELLAYPEGALPGVFSVSPTKKICFSRGNLQFQTTKGVWRFAEQQFDIIGSNNGKVNKYNDGWMDLFGWGTGDDPIKRDASGVSYCQFSDWGNNVIIDEGKQSKLWYTLTMDEWKYLVERRKTSSGMRYVYGRVGVRNGLILLPDVWNYAYPFINPNCSGDYKMNSIDLSKWVKLESEGAVFLPAAGWRDKTSAGLAQICGMYWSSTNYGSSEAYFFYISESFDFSIGDHHWGREMGGSVRLVCPI